MIKKTIKTDARNLRYFLGNMLADFASERYNDKRLILFTDYITDFLKEYCKSCNGGVEVGQKRNNQ